MSSFRTTMFVFIVLFIFSGNGYFAYIVYNTEGVEATRIAVVIQAFGIISGLTFFIYTYFDTRKNREQKLREAWSSRYESTRRSFLDYIDKISERPDLGLFHYLPIQDRKNETLVHTAVAHIYALSFVEQGLEKSRIIHGHDGEAQEMWKNFALRLWAEPHFAEFFEYNSYKWRPSVVDLFESVTARRFAKANISDYKSFLAKLDL